MSRRRQWLSPGLDESIMQGVPRAESAVYRCLDLTIVDLLCDALVIISLIITPPPYGAFWNSMIRPSIRLSVPWRSCLGHRHADCLQLSHRRPPEMCGLRTCLRTDGAPPRFLPPSNCISSRRPLGVIPCYIHSELK